MITVWWDRGPQAARHLLRWVLAATLGGEPDAVGVGRSCAACGSADHGKPYALAAPELGLSVSRAGGLTAVAVGGCRPVGLDVEDVMRIPPGAAALVGLAQTTPAASVARRWVRTEAVLKASGLGLSVPPEGLIVPDGVRVVDLELPSPHVGALAVLGDDEPRVRVRRWAP